MNRVRLLWAGATVAALALTACDKKAKGDQAEKAMRERFAVYGPIDNVSCPKTIKVEKDAHFECTVKFTGGDEFKVDAAISEVSGKNFKYGIEIAEPIFAGPHVANSVIQPEFSKQRGVDAKVDCGAVRKPSGTGTESCLVTVPSGESAKIEVTVDDKGQVTGWKVIDE